MSGDYIQGCETGWRRRKDVSLLRNEESIERKTKCSRKEIGNAQDDPDSLGPNPGGNQTEGTVLGMRKLRRPQTSRVRHSYGRESLDSLFSSHTQKKRQLRDGIGIGLFPLPPQIIGSSNREWKPREVDHSQIFKNS